MSQKTGVIFCHCSACAVATKVNDGTMTSPLRPSARVTISSATVALHITTQCLTPTMSAMRCSNSRTNGPPLDSQRVSSIWLNRSISRSRLPMLGRPTCRSSPKTGVPPKIARSSMVRRAIDGSAPSCAGPISGFAAPGSPAAPSSSSVPGGGKPLNAPVGPVNGTSDPVFMR